MYVTAIHFFNLFSSNLVTMVMFEWSLPCNYTMSALNLSLGPVGFTLSLFLSLHYRANRSTWTDRYYYYLSLIGPPSMVLGPLYLGLLQLIPSQTEDLPGWLQTLGQVFDVLRSGIQSTYIVVFVMLSVMHYLHVKNPLWCVLYANKFRKSAIGYLAFSVLLRCVTFVGVSVAEKGDWFGWSSTYQVLYGKNLNATIFYTLLLEVPDFAFIVAASVTVWATFIHARTKPELRNIENQRVGEFWMELYTLKLITIGTIVWFVLYFVDFVVVFKMDKTKNWVALYWFLMHNEAIPCLLIYCYFVLVFSHQGMLDSFIRFVRSATCQVDNYRAIP